jgi:hypothetical protein
MRLAEIGQPERRRVLVPNELPAAVAVFWQNSKYMLSTHRHTAATLLTHAKEAVSSFDLCRPSPAGA